MVGRTTTSTASAKSRFAVIEHGHEAWVNRGLRGPSISPIGTDIAGTPARLAVAVKMSFRYISYGSDFAPNSKATLGVVGVKSRCTPESNTSRKS